MNSRPLAQAVLAVTVLWPQILEEVILAEHAAEPHAERHRRLDAAIAKAKELVTRLETAKILYAATPLEDGEPP